MIRIGRRVYHRNGTYTDPFFPGFTPVIVLTKSSEYGSLGPYVLKDERGFIMENIYQGSKAYEKVPAACEKYSRYDRTIIWEHPEETHIDSDGNLTSEYYAWRKKLMANPYAVRYPLGFGNNKYCKYAYRDGHEDERLDYIQTRKLIYVPLYCSLVKKQKQFQELKQRLEKGENLLIIEVDGPHEESLYYYKKKYGVEDDFIINNTMLLTEANNKIMLNDEKWPYGHSYALGLCLIDKDEEWNV